MASENIELDILTMQDLFGISDTNLKILEKELAVRLVTRDGKIEVSGESESNIHLTVQTLRMLNQMRAIGEKIDEFAVVRALGSVREGKAEETVVAMKDVVAYTYSGAPVKCRTLGQRKYIKAIEENTVTITAGTEKISAWYDGPSEPDGLAPVGNLVFFRWEDGAYTAVFGLQITAEDASPMDIGTLTAQVTYDGESLTLNDFHLTALGGV